MGDNIFDETNIQPGTSAGVKLMASIILAGIMQGKSTLLIAGQEQAFENNNEIYVDASIKLARMIAIRGNFPY